MLDLERELEHCEKVHEQSPDSATWSQPKTAKVNLTLLLVLPAHKLAAFRLQHNYQIARQRLNTPLSKITKTYQTRFTRDRYSSDYFRRLFDIIDQVNAQKTPALLASLDAEKVFNRMDWSFLFSVLERFNMDPNFIKGCSLSPLLYLLGAEPLVELIRSNPSIMDVYAGGLQHKISLHAEYVLLYISHILRNQEDKYIRVSSLRNRRLTSPQLAASLNSTCKTPVSTSTVMRQLQDAGLLGRVPLSSVCVFLPILIFSFYWPV
ncbi:unnamed protein product [Oncorhynchus mykiss]|uniref:Reverse transcriptase domain-containing protein n=1 Tax=Oncorhynchus mykiss TaxID=8022 RepID=A0A060W676_ONCMY|nr:unnamed protein product [Oncorhynchus mykiss]